MPEEGDAVIKIFTHYSYAPTGDPSEVTTKLCPRFQVGLADGDMQLLQDQADAEGCV